MILILMFFGCTSYIAYSVIEIASQPLTIVHILEGICVLRPNNTHHIMLWVAASRLTNAAQVVVITDQAFETVPHQRLLAAIADHIRMDLTPVLPLAVSFIIITVIICCVILTVIITVVII
jgi:hypothetical protein